MTLKIADDYAADILQFHTELKSLPPYHPDYEPMKARLNHQLGMWQSKLSIIIRVASNERHPWQEDVLGYVIIPMELKKFNHHAQIGDYTYEILNDDGSITLGLLVVERKGGKTGPEDLYSTLMNRDGRERFYREIERYESDTRFNQMVIIAECNQQDFMKYAPAFNGRKQNTNHVAATVQSRRATIAGLYARGIPVLWAGDREEAQKIYRELIRQSIIKNYESILVFEYP